MDLPYFLAFDFAPLAAVGFDADLPAALPFGFTALTNLSCKGSSSSLLSSSGSSGTGSSSYMEREVR